MVVVNGVLFGLLLAILIGPVFFTLIQTSIEKGFSKAILVAVGIALSDISYIVLAYFGISKFLKSSGYDASVAYLGGAILIGFGLASFFRSRKVVNLSAKSIEAKGFFRYVIKGFIINGLSPFVLLFWVGAMGLATAEYNYTGFDLALFFAVIIVVVLLTDLLKAYLAGKLRSFFTPRLFKILNIVVGTALCLFGLRLLAFDFF
ncbi:LysE family translocator [Fulvivirga sp. RKSG066]|uniref:LysE family translocator n=1 Tax=Fulvivirga aurantia TaxID=2529383 RepID=UPI0012BCAE1A|nr:LysE family transporter [Fulvivirga aurantia]MTI20733.1 LysE family translocator [Fulvivirga aurantia]